MISQIKDRWIRALKSGEYQQGKHQLRTPDNKFCCMGVLCDLYCKETGKDWGRADRLDEEGYCCGGDYLDLPQEVQDWAGLDEAEPNVYRVPEGPKIGVSCLNDGYHMSFSEIADVIEEQL